MSSLSKRQSPRLKLISVMPRQGAADLQRKEEVNYLTLWSRAPHLASVCKALLCRGRTDQTFGAERHPGSDLQDGCEQASLCGPYMKANLEPRRTGSLPLDSGYTFTDAVPHECCARCVILFSRSGKWIYSRLAWLDDGYKQVATGIWSHPQGSKDVFCSFGASQLFCDF